MRSHLLEGKVRHRALDPFVYELEHDVFYFALDLAELDEVTGSDSALVSRNRRERARPSATTTTGLPPATDLARDRPARTCASQGVDPTGWRITLVTNLRVLGYVFNPASFYLCRDAAGELRVVIVEVHNTHGERHLYTLRPEAPGEQLTCLDGQGLLRVAVHRHGGRATRCACGTTRRACGSRSTSARTARRVLTTSLVLARACA